jgi:hypothetical protein
VFTAWYALSPYIKQIRFVSKGLMHGIWIIFRSCDLFLVSVHHRKVSIKRRPRPTRGCCVTGEKAPYSLHSNRHLTHCQCYIHQPTDVGTFTPPTIAQPYYTLNMRCSISHQTWQLCGTIKPLRCKTAFVCHLQKNIYTSSTCPRHAAWRDLWRRIEETDTRHGAYIRIN